MNGADGVMPAVRRRGWMMLGGVGLLGGLLFAVGYGPHVRATAEATAASDAAALPLVVVVPARKGKDSADVSFPATLQALQEATLYARTAGYVKRWHAEMGDRVKAGQLLAELEAPELDRELDQARAASAQARAHLDLARTTAERYRGLVKQEAVSSQEADERIGALAAREADYAVTQARIRQLDSMKAFQRVVAPFSGTVVARNLEVGSLVAAGNSASTPWLYKIVQSDTLRVLVSVPQSHVAAVKTGTEAELHIRELGGKPIVARVVRNAGAFDSATRTLLTELRVPNPDGRIFPGMYGQVKFHVQYDTPPIVVPVNALLVGGAGLRVAVVDATDRVRIRPVKVGRDLGKEVEILEGLEENERVVNNPRDELVDGLKVKAVATPKAEDQKKADAAAPIRLATAAP